MEIYSKQSDQIRAHLYSVKYEHGLSIMDVTGGYSLNKYAMLTTMCLYIELPGLIRQIRKVDPDCLITVNPIADVDGKMHIYQQGSTD
jgi:uncharacterized membrane-anchored protein YitT (DUF2179 family)